ncbi:MAG TPA: monovalent cation/H+ antiporter subunit D family protein [Vicinamibacteria bacterium]|nr:monovalent cation/H+ antiporter subunit D family protein [Vicinamibacteria bacterium]
MRHAPVLVVLAPLLNALACPLIAYVSATAARGVTRLALGISLVCSSVALSHSLAEGPWHYHLAGWPPPWGIEIVIDSLSGVMAVLVSAMGFLGAIYSDAYLSTATDERAGIFYSVFSLLVTGLLGIVVTGDLFNLYVFLEISSLSAYALLATGGSRAVVATFRYLLVGTVAASFYLIGVGYLYAMTGTLNMADMSGRLAVPPDSPVVLVGVSFIVIGLAIKAALFPLHGWLPDAYTFAPGPVIGFIAAVMAKVSAYALYRILYFVFRAESVPGEPLMLLGWASALAVVAGSVMAVAQKDVQRMLAYSSIGQMGYIIMGVAMGTPLALIGALLHVVNHAVMKGCLFMAVNGVQWQAGIFRIRDFTGVAKRFPITMTAFTTAALSMIGLPPTAGFFSKYYLALAAVETGHLPFLVALVLSSLLGAVYFFRVIERAYLMDHDGPETPSTRDLPGSMLIPIVVLALAVVLLGVFNQTVANELLEPGLP